MELIIETKMNLITLFSYTRGPLANYTKKDIVRALQTEGKLLFTTT